MEAFGIIGMSLGSSGFVFGLLALVQSSSLKNEFEKLKSTLKESGTLVDKTNEEDQD